MVAALIVEPHAGHGDRQERGRDAGSIHVGKRFLRGPFQGLRQTELALFQIRNVGRRREVMVHVNQRGLGWRLRRARRRHKAAQRQAAGRVGADPHESGDAALQRRLLVLMCSSWYLI